jgi:GTP-binding protein
MVDTGGIGLLRGEKSVDPIARAALQQVELAVASAELILFVVDAMEGMVALDREVADRLRASGKPVMVVVNKADNASLEGQAPEFTRLGFERMMPVSAIHDRGVEALLDAVVGLLPQGLAGSGDATGAGQAAALRLAVVGRPNVGKSSLVNALTRSERVIVSPVPGTTRDSVDVPFEIETDGVRERWVLVDTAGIRKERRIDNSVEFYSVNRAEESIARSDLVILVLDAEAGVLEQDKKVADKILESRKACVVVVNKWDLLEEAVASAQAKLRQEPKARDYDRPKTLTTLADFGAWVQRNLFFLSYAPVIFTSAKSGFHLDRLLEAIRFVAAQGRQKVATALLNRTLQEAVERRQPVSDAGHHLRFFYATQTGQSPPSFLLFVNRKELFSPAYTRYLEGILRTAFGFEGCPVILNVRARPKHELESKSSGRRAQRRPGRGDKGRPARGRGTARDRGVKGRHRR